MASVEETTAGSTRTGTALCLSGGGFRATLFHLGSIRRLNELGLLSKVNLFSSVSGGSILNAVLAAHWNQLTADAVGRFTNLDQLITEPLIAFCQRDLRTHLWLWSRLNPGNWLFLLKPGNSITNLLAEAYTELPGLGQGLNTVHGDATFVFCATNLSNGVNWEFRCGGNQPARMGDYLNGYRGTASLTIAQAVAASSAFPLAFPPMVLTRRSVGGTQNKMRQTFLTDGGVYDNLGLEPSWKKYRTLLVADAGAPFRSWNKPRTRFVPRLARCQDIMGNQSLALRKRWLIQAYKDRVMDGTYWGLKSNFSHYHCDEGQGYEGELLQLISRVRTDLNVFSNAEISILQNHGYALADVAIRRWQTSVISGPTTPFSWPNPSYSPVHQLKVKEVLSDSSKRNILKDITKMILRNPLRREHRN